MDTRTGEIRELREDESLPELDESRDAALSPEVGISQEERDALMELPPDLRLAHLFGMRGGKDRKAQGRPGVTTKTERHAQRKTARQSRRKNR